MNRATPILIALAALSATPLAAQGQAGYSATPAAAPSKASFITRSVVWHCTDGVCTAPKAGSRPEIMCELLAKEVGQLSDFTVDGAALAADKLAKCNTKAR